MRLDALDIKDFLGHEETYIDFTATPLVAITGPVGSGKSSIIDAFTWCLWGESRARGRQYDPLVREGAERCRVEATVFHESRQFHIVRNREKGGTSSLTFDYDEGEATGSLTGHTLAETQEAINLEFGLDYDGMTAGPIAIQDGNGLMHMKPTARKEVLLSLLVPGTWEKWHEEAKRLRTTAQADIDSASRALAAYPTAATVRTQLETLGEEIAQAMANLTDEHSRVSEAREDTARIREDVATANARSQEAVLLREQADENHRRYKEQGELDVAYTSRVANGRAHMGDLKEKEAADQYNDADHQGIKTRLTNRMAQTTEIGQRLASLRTAVKHAGEKVTCPNCAVEFHPGAPDYDRLAADLGRTQSEFDIASTEVKKMQEEERTIRDAIERRRMWKREWDLAETTMASLLEQAEDSHTRLLQLKQDGQKLDSRLGALRDDIGAVEVLQRRLEAAQTAERAADDRVKVWQRTVNEKENERRTQAGRLEAIEKAEALHATAHTNFDIYEVLASAFHPNGIPTLMLESRLPNVQRFTNEALAKMPGDMRLDIRTQKVSKEGNASETLDVLVTVGGQERGYEMLSGGQKFRVDLAIRLALTRTLSSQAIDTLVVDEGFDRFQDPEGREAIMESLMAVASGFSRIIVVSHHPDVIDRFGQRLDVTMEEGVSRVT